MVPRSQEPFLFPRQIAESDLLALSFDLRGENCDAEAVSSLVGWLIEEFSMKRCAYLASAVASQIGREHYVAFMHPDGRLAHAVVACAPQHGRTLRGDCLDVMGRRPLAETHRALDELTGPVAPEIGGIVSPGEYRPGEMEALLLMAAALPWMRSALRMPKARPSGTVLLKAASALGMASQPAESAASRATA